MPFGQGSGKDKKHPSFTGRYMIDTWRGVPRIRKWPRKRGPAKTPGDKKRQEQFAKWMEATKYIAAIEQASAEKAARGTPFYPRDLMVMALSGRMFSIRVEGGKEIFSMAARRDVSASLDVLSQVEGDVLFRGQEFWERLPIGEPLSSLIVSPDGKTIEWGKPDAGVSGKQVVLQYPGARSTSGFAGKGTLIRPVLTFIAHKLVFYFDAVSGEDYVAHVLKLDAQNRITSILASSEASTSPSTAFRAVAFDLLTPARLEGDGRYAFMLYRTSSSPTASAGLRGGNGFNRSMPMFGNDTAVRDRNATEPIVGNQMDTNPGGFNYYALVSFE